MQEYMNGIPTEIIIDEQQTDLEIIQDILGEIDHNIPK